MKVIKRAAEIGLIVILIGICLLTIQAGRGKVPYVFGYRILKVVSDSMRPVIESGTCIIIEKVEQENIKIGDIVTFVSSDPSIRGYNNTHRIHDIVSDAESGTPLYLTKGDASIEMDSIPVAYEDIIGKYRCELPFGKYVYNMTEFLMDSKNYFIVVILPLLLCLLSYIKQLWNTLFAKEHKEDGDKGEK